MGVGTVYLYYIMVYLNVGPAEDIDTIRDSREDGSKALAYRLWRAW